MSKKCKCNIISFGNINLYILLIPLGALFSTAENIISNLSEKLCKKTIETGQHPIIICIIYALGLCLSFILFIIYKKCNKRNKNSNFLLITDTIKKNKEERKGKKYLWILLSSVLDFLANMVYSYYYGDSDDYLAYWSTNIILQSLFSYWLLKIKLYRHHYLSIIFITIIGLTYNFCSGFFTLDKIKKNYKGYINYFVAESIYNILYVLYKFFMIKKFIKSYEILFYQGVI